MRIIRKLLMAAGALALAAVAAVAWLAGGSDHFREAHGAMAVRFAERLSEDWDPTRLEPMMARALVAEIDSPGGRRLIEQGARLGVLVSAAEPRLVRYRTALSGKSGVFRFDGEYEFGHAVVTVTVAESGPGVGVVGFHLSIRSLRPGPPRRHGA